MALAQQAPHSPDPIASALRTLETERDGLTILMEAIGNGLGSYFTAAVETLAAARGRVVVTGMGKSGHVGRKITATFASTGTPSHYVHPAEASHGDLGMIQTDDVIIALSWSGETAELADIIAYSRRFRVPLIALTSNAESTLGRAADICLTLPKAKEACPNGLAPTTSTTIQLALGDALAVALLEKRGFTAEHFKVFHPGGKLGARLKLVRDIMHIGERLPVVGLEARMDEAIGEIGRKGFGAVIVVNRRRHARRHRHRRRPAPPPDAGPHDPAGDGDHDQDPAHHRAGRPGRHRPGDGRGFPDHGPDRGRERPARRPRALPRPAARRRCLKVCHTALILRRPSGRLEGRGRLQCALDPPSRRHFVAPQDEGRD